MLSVIRHKFLSHEFFFHVKIMKYNEGVNYLPLSRSKFYIRHLKALGAASIEIET